MYRFFLLMVIGLFPMVGLAAEVPNEVPNEIVVQWAANPGQVMVYAVDNVTSAIADLQNRPEIKLVEPNYYRQLAVAPTVTTPDDPLYSSAYHLDQASDADIDAPEAWDTTTGSESVIVAVVDTGVDITHPDLVDNIWTNSGEIADNGIDDEGNGYIDDVHGWDFVDNDNNPTPDPTTNSDYITVDVDHGTHVAGIIGATGNNTTDVTGVAWQVQLMPLRIFDLEGFSSTATEVEALDYARTNGAMIVSMSYGGEGESSLEAEAIAALHDADIVAVAAAGNFTIDLNTTPWYPVCFDNVIGVAATDDIDTPADFSNYGDDCVDVSAPGVNILSTLLFNDDPSLGGDFSSYTGYLSGTSMATPIVSGIAGLLKSDVPDLSADEITTAITNSTDSLGNTNYGSGRVNAAAALSALNTLSAPAKPVITAYTNSKKRVTIAKQQRSADGTPYFTWTEPSADFAITGYYVYFGTDKADPRSTGVFRAKHKYKAGSAVTGDGKSYRLRVQAVDSQGSLSAVSSFRYLLDTIVPAPISNPIVLAATSNDLTWRMTAGQHVIGYEVARSDHRNGQYHYITIEPISSRSLNDTDIDLTKAYYYKVRAIDNLGNVSDWSDPELAQP